jgi:hypothetical protein
LHDEPKLSIANGPDRFGVLRVTFGSFRPFDFAEGLAAAGAGDGRGRQCAQIAGHQRVQRHARLDLLSVLFLPPSSPVLQRFENRERARNFRPRPNPWRLRRL